jgi:hypothetical protein
MGERGWSDDVKIGLGCGDGSVMVRCGEKRSTLSIVGRDEKVRRGVTCLLLSHH